MEPRIEILPWDRPLLEQAVEWLARDLPTGNLDLSRHLIVVPTREAGRRLRERLALFAAERQSGVVGPLVVTPEFLVTYPLNERAVADRLACLMAWTRVLQSMEIEDFRAVFPRDPVERDFHWALQTGQMLDRLKRSLAEGGLNISDVNRICGSSFEEVDRWEALGRLEEAYRAVLTEEGLEDPSEARNSVSQAPSLPEEVEQVTFLGVPDPIPPAVAAAEKIAESIPIRVVVLGPRGGEALFDEWGRPIKEVWQERPIPYPELEKRVHLVDKPLQQARKTERLVDEYSEPECRVAIGLLDREVRPFLGETLSSAPVFDPEGESCERHELFALLEILKRLLRGRDYAVCGELIRHPSYFRFLRETLPAFSLERLLWEWDDFRERHLPATLDEASESHGAGAARYPTLNAVLRLIRTQLEPFQTEPFSKALSEWLRALFQQSRVNEMGEDGEPFLSAAYSLMAWLKSLGESSFLTEGEGGLEASDWLELLLSVFRDERIYSERPEGAIDLQGWLELLWEDAPHLILTGCHDGNLPESIVGDPFLPDGLRRTLGLKENAGRLARDTYLMEALIESRSGNGRIDWIVGRAANGGDPVRPSRLFFQCPRKELPRRARHLFQEVASTDSRVAWQPAFTLRPQNAGEVTRLTVTQFKDYLACPFRFYLKHLLRMEPVDPWKAEMDPLDFGGLCHEVLQKMGEDPGVSDTTDVRVIQDLLQDELNRCFRARFGNALSAPLLIQKEALRQRLLALGEQQASERAKGWVIEAVEWAFEKESLLFPAGLSVRGKIDRVDRNEQSGELRVLDYKTSEQGISPREAHCRKLTGQRAVDRPQCAYFQWADQSYRWIDLQLPLYVWVARETFGKDAWSGYFNLPKAKSATGVAIWESLSSELVDAALECAQGVGRAVCDGRFWPPVERVEYDDFESLFFNSVGSSVDGDYFEQAQR